MNEMVHCRSNNEFAQTQRFVFILCVLCAVCGSTFAQDFKILKAGVEYAEVTNEISGLNVNINLLRLDLTKVRLDVHHAMDAAIGTEKTSSLATRHGAFAAINAGFFRLDKSIWAGDDTGALKINNKIFSESFPGRRTSLFINNQSSATKVEIFPLKTSIDLSFGSEKEGWGIDGINRQIKTDELVLYTPDFGRTTLTDPGTVEITVRNGRVSQYSDRRGSSIIPSDGYVISGSGSRVASIREFAASRKKIKLNFSAFADIDPQLGIREPHILAYYQSEDIVTGVPQLIKDGKIDITWENEGVSKSFVETRHPRTAVAKLKDGKFLMITVDGRTESSGGIGLQDLAEYLLLLGATDAMNLDGGGSTTMFVDGKVVNHPSDKEGERKVGDAILVTLRDSNKRKN